MQIISTLSSDKTKRVAAIERSLIEPIGEITVNFAMLEQIVKHGIEYLLFPDDESGQSSIAADTITSEMSFRRLVDLFHCLIMQKCSEQDVEKSADFCTRISKLEERRNSITHSNWVLDGSTKSTIRVKVTAKRKGLKRTEETISKADIQKIADDIAVIAKELEEFIRS